MPDPPSPAFPPLLAGIGPFTVAVNLLMLAGAIYMLQVYDRVLPSRSVPTLIALTGLIIAAYAVQGLLDAARGRLLARLAATIEERLAPQLFADGLHSKATISPVWKSPVAITRSTTDSATN